MVTIRCSPLSFDLGSFFRWVFFPLRLSAHNRYALDIMSHIFGIDLIECDIRSWDILYCHNCNSLAFEIRIISYCGRLIYYNV